jgi:hypothetical protein
MRAVVKSGLFVVAAFCLSAFFFLWALAVGQLSPAGDPSAYRTSGFLLLASATFLAVAIWRLVVLLRRHAGENLS